MRAVHEQKRAVDKVATPESGAAAAKKQQRKHCGKIGARLKERENSAAFIYNRCGRN